MSTRRTKIVATLGPASGTPGRIAELIEAGMELGDANDQVFDTTDSKKQGGAYGLLTNGLYTRESIYYQTLVIAMVPFVNPLFSDYEKVF